MKLLGRVDAWLVRHAIKPPDPLFLILDEPGYTRVTEAISASVAYRQPMHRTVALELAKAGMTADDIADFGLSTAFDIRCQHGGEAEDIAAAIGTLCAVAGLTGSEIRLCVGVVATVGRVFGGSPFLRE